LNTYGFDAGYFITPVLKASAGYYYQHRDQEHVDGSGVRVRLAYEMTSGVTAGANISYDEAFDTRVSADIKVRFGGASTTAERKDIQQLPVINALTASPSNRDVRVHDANHCKELIEALKAAGRKLTPMNNGYVYFDKKTKQSRHYNCITGADMLESKYNELEQLSKSIDAQRVTM
jgi:hypothetical protein